MVAWNERNSEFNSRFKSNSFSRSNNVKCFLDVGNNLHQLRYLCNEESQEEAECEFGGHFQLLSE